MYTKNRTRIFSVFTLGVLFILLNSCFKDEMAAPPPEPKPLFPRDYNVIAAGYGHSLALSNEQYSVSTLWAWGDNAYGQLGDSTMVNKSRPFYIGLGYTAIAAGGSHSLGLKYDTLFAWGDNRFGQVGDNTNLNKNLPIQIATGFSDISAGFSHSLALKQDGTLWAWGDNAYGQLGDGTIENRNTPVQIGTSYSRIAAGGRHSLALKTDGTLWAWGNNEYGQVGDGTNVDQHTPVQIGSGYSMIAHRTIAAGGRHSLALKYDTLFAWGDNEYGQLGDGTNEDRNIPVKIYTSLLGQYNPYIIAAGESHSLFLEPNNVLWAWGRNDVGQLGDGTIENRNTPLQIESVYKGLAAGGAHSFALKAEAKTEWIFGLGYTYYIYHLWAWGDNQFGQLGYGDFPFFRNTPLHIGPG